MPKESMIIDEKFVENVCFAIVFNVVLCKCQRELTTITPLSIITSHGEARLPESVAGLFHLPVLGGYAIVS